MRSSSESVTKTYQFISEGILFYLLLGPVFFIFFPQTPLPFWSFLLTLVLSKIVLTQSVRKTLSYIPIILYVPITVYMLGVFADYNLILASILSMYLAWRFIVHERDPSLENEQDLTMWTLGLLIMNVMFFNQSSVFFMASIQLIVLVFGYLLSHVVQVNAGASNKPLNVRTGLIMGVFLGITMGVFILYDTARAGLVGGLSIIVVIFRLVLQGLASIFLFFGFDELYKKILDARPDQPDVGSSFGNQPQGGVGLDDAQPSIDMGSILYWGALLVVIVVGVVIAIRLRNRMIEQEAPVQESNTPFSYRAFSKEERSSLRSRMKSLFKSHPNEGVRKLFFEFEAYATKLGYGRKPYETIEEWFERVGVTEEEVSLYQKARYGEQELTQQELTRLKERLNRLKGYLKDQQTAEANEKHM